MATRGEVVKCFKTLLRTSRAVFRDDGSVQEKARQEIRKGFEKNRSITDPAEVAKLVRLGHDVAVELEASVVRVERNEKTGNLVLRIEERHLMDNATFPPPPQTISSRNRRERTNCSSTSNANDHTESASTQKPQQDGNSDGGCCGGGMTNCR